MLTAMSEEEETVPLHYSLPSLCSGLKLECVPIKQFKGILKELGYKASHFHREPTAVKTDAPNSVVYDILRKWSAQRKKEKGIKDDDPKSKNASKKRKNAGPTLSHVLERSISTEGLMDLSFEVAGEFEEKLENGQKPRKIPRFLPNPEKFWGPKPRAKPVNEK